MTEPCKTPIHEVYFAAGTDPNYGGQQLHNVVLLDDHLRETQELVDALEEALQSPETTISCALYDRLSRTLARHRANQQPTQ